MRRAIIAGAILAVYYKGGYLLLQYLQVAGIAGAILCYLHESLTGMLILAFCRYSR